MGLALTAFRSVAVVGLMALSAVQAAAGVFSFEITVNSGNGAPLTFIQSWASQSTGSSPPYYYDFGGGNGLLKSSVYHSMNISPSPFTPEVSGVSGVAPFKHSGSLFAELGIYVNNGVPENYVNGQIRFENSQTQLVNVGNDKLEYRQYYSYVSPYNFSFNNLSVMELTDSNLDMILKSVSSFRWAETGNLTLLASSGEPLGFSSVVYSGTARYLGVQSAVPEPSTWAMMMIGFAGLGYAGYRKRKAVPAAA